MRRCAGAFLAVAVAGCTVRMTPSQPVVPKTTGSVFLPDGYRAGHRYPLLVMLPASNGTAEAMRLSYPETGDVIVLVASGRGTPADYLTNEAWARTMTRYERQLRSDVSALVSSGHVESGEVFLAGFSMGGDLAWALALRNPDLVKGAVVMGSRLSYRSTAQNHERLRARRARFYLIMGEDEDDGRMRGVQQARTFLQSLEIDHRYRRVPNHGHLRAPPEVFNDGLDYVLR